MVDEKVEPLTLDFFEEQECIRNNLKSWAAQAPKDIAGFKPVFEGRQSNRARDNWTPIFQVAEVASKAWSDKTRGAFQEIEENRKRYKTTSSGAELLSDIRELLGDEKHTDIRSATLLQNLLSKEDADWNRANNGREITQKWLAGKLKLYGVHPRKRTAFNVYLRTELEEVFKRYLPPIS